MQSIKKQQGKSFIATALFVVMAGFILVVGMKLLPGYLEYFNVRSSMESLAKEKALRKMSPAARVKNAKKLLYNRFTVNDVKTVKFQKDVTFKRDGNDVEMNVKYNKIIPVMGNVSALLKFNETVKLEGE